MGVKNLWRLLLPVGHRLSIETLSHQTLAIDASIWLTQISKACRDPETGRLLPNKPHVRIFLLRLMRLLFHQIKPVVVFDGVMPEVKRREIQRRKDRREKLWRDDEGGEGGGALKRTAKKILVKQLKEWREKEARLKKEKGGKDAIVENNKEEDVKNGSMAIAQSDNGSGALASGFTLADDATENINSSAARLPNPGKKRSDTNKIKTGESNEDVISINSEDSKEKASQKFQSQLGEFQQQHEADEVKKGEHYESENDWELSHAIQSSINDSIQQQQQKQQLSSNETTQFSHSHYQLASNKTIAALPNETRSQWIDSQKSARRIQSRRECMDAAACPEDYSSTQLRNFLMASKLNKRVGEIGRLVESRADVGIEEEEEDDVFGDDAQRTARPELQRLKRHNNDHSDSDEDNDIFTSTNGANKGRASMKVLFGEDDSDSDEEGGGGFLVSSPAKPIAKAADSAQYKSEENEAVLLESDDSDNDDNSQSDGNAALANRSASANENGNIDCHNSPPSKNTKTTTNNFLELSTAGQEWEEWGGASSDEESNALEAQPAQVENGTNGTSLFNASESDSDSSGDGQGGTFLMLGNRPLSSQVTKSVSCSAARKSVAEKMSVAPIGADRAQNIAADMEEEEDDDDVDWEDGESGDDHIEDEIDTANDDAKNGAQEPSLGDHEDMNGNGNRKVVKWNESARVADSLKTDASISTQNNGAGKCQKDHPKHVAAKFNSRLNGKKDIIEIPSEDDISEKEGVEAPTKKDSPESNPTPNNTNNKEPLEIDSSDESTSENNEFESFYPDNQTNVALQKGQETASRLTSWAGRAFERAMSAHAGQQTQSALPSKKVEFGIDLTASDDVIDSDASNNSNGAEDSTQVKGLDQSKTTGMDDENHDSSPEQQQNPPRKLDLFDTSLEGLNEAHNAILEEEKAMERDMSTITDEMKEDILSLLRLCGIPWVESPSEAEAQCAALEELGLVDGVVTEDSDIFVFGGRKVYKNFFNEQKYVEAYFARDIERDLALRKHQLVALAMLLGGDYTDGIKGVGIVNGMEALQAFPIDDSADGIKDGLQKLREWLDGFDDLSNYGSDKTYLSKEALFRKKHSSARTRWVAPADFPSPAIINAYLKPVVDKSKTKFSWGTPNLQGLQQYCAETLGWEQEETDRIVNPVLKVLESGSKQTRLESYFMKYEDGIKFAAVRSKRLQAVLEGIQGGGNDMDIEGVAEEADGEMEASEADEGAKPKKKRQRRKK